MIEHHNRTTAGRNLSEEQAASAFVSRLSLGAVVMLRKHVTALERIESAANVRRNV
jgi:ubiquitin-conjugating enzyme E2 O